MTESCRRGHPRTPENTAIRPDGTRGCRVCNRARNRRYANSDKGRAYYRPRVAADPHQYARQLIGRLVRTGHMVKLACAVCGDPKSQATTRTGTRVRPP